MNYYDACIDAQDRLSIAQHLAGAELGDMILCDRGDSSDVEIPGLTHANAERMKSFILQSTEHADEQE